MRESTAVRATQVRRDPRWAAVVARDRRADGRFFYSVRTTGIYCRPSCGARTPRPENVGFHDTAAAAERAGYRACRRCRPDGIADGPAAVVIALCAAMERGEPLPAFAEIARREGIGAAQLRRRFIAMTGLLPKAYALAARAGRLREGLAVAGTATDAIHAAGFASSGHFHAQSASMLGMSARTFRSGGAGAVVHFAVGQCSLGGILVAMTERGLCALLLGDDPDALLHDLQDRFPRATLVGGDAEFESGMAAVIAVVDDPSRALALPIDLQGTAFQHRVWQALREIPSGRTVSYADLAARLGVPRAVRAVARACAANPLAVVIPCHRVVRSDGALAGYRWGVARKQALLVRESGER